MSASTSITVRNIRSNKLVTVPAPGRIVTVFYDKLINYDYKPGTEKWEGAKVTGIVLGYTQDYDVLASGRADAISVMDLTGNRTAIPFSRIVKTTATRSVPKEGRSALTSIYKWESREAVKWDKQIKELQARRDAALAASGAKDPARTLADALGAVTADEFASLVSEKLDKALPSFSRDNWRISFWNGRLSACRDFSFSKYYSGELSYLEYDDSRCLIPDAAETEEGKGYIKRYRRVLPITAKLSEGLGLGDKNWLYYWESYELADLPKGEILTKAKADELVERLLVRKGAKK